MAAEEFIPEQPKTCQMPHCKFDSEVRLKAKPPYRTDSQSRPIRWFWVCQGHGDQLQEKGYEPMETLF